MANTPRPPLVAGLDELAGHYPAILCDVWGVIHDGLKAFAWACEALIAYRAGGGRVVLITNAPRPRAAVLTQLDRLGVPRDAFDALVTSGEVARELLAARPGAKVLHIGPERDLSIYDGLPIALTGEAEAELISCTGLFDDTTETPDDYREQMDRWRASGLPMLCANPDMVVERGDRLVWCAGALAERYRQAGGKTTVVGKPHPAIYRAALAGLGDRSPVLAIGDGIDTDVRGAVAAGLDVAFVTGGIHAAQFGPRDAPDVPAVHAFLAEAGLTAAVLMTRLAWRRRH
jgi:HAD superfamily hydrolase (TIGR01459 family)